MKLSANELLRLAKDARLRLETLKLPEPAVKICVAALARLEKVLAQPPRVAIMGEVNSGKTSVADLLLGAGILPSSVVVNTHVPVLIKYAEDVCLDAITQQGRRRLTDENLDGLPSGLQLKRIEIGLPSPRLLAFEILDTPSGYSPGAGQPDAQIHVWCTVATRAWTESERAHWSQLPRRCRRNGLLVATHKDALAHTGDIEKVALRLTSATDDMFRDVVFATATGAQRHDMLPYPDAPLADRSADLLLERIVAWALEVSVRRASKAERIIRHLARLTFHRLEPGPLSSDAAAILKAWERDCAKLLAGVDGSPTAAARVIQAMLARFAHSVSEARAGRVAPRAATAPPERSIPVSGSFRAAAMRRYVGLIGADLTALLRIDLAQWGLREPTHYLDYATARSILLPLANLDATFDELGQKFSTPSAGTVPPRQADALRTGTRLS
jgi:Dynamin family